MKNKTKQAFESADEVVRQIADFKHAFYEIKLNIQLGDQSQLEALMKRIWEIESLLNVVNDKIGEAISDCYESNLPSHQCQCIAYSPSASGHQESCPQNKTRFDTLKPND